MTKSTTRRFLCCLLALCCLLGSLTAFSLAAGTSYPYSASVNADTNLRRSPSSAESNIIARIPKGTILTVTGASGNFLCVTYDGQVGYIFKQYAEQVTTNTSDPAASRMASRTTRRRNPPSICARPAPPPARA